MNKPILILLVLVVLAAAIGGYFYWMGRGPSVDNNSVVIGRQDLPLSQVPQGFPDQVKVPAEGRVVESFNQGFAGNQLQATRIIDSSKSVDDNFKYYSEMISSRYGWAVQSVSTSSPVSKAIAAQNINGRINVNITKSGTGSRVDISFIEQK